MLANVFPSRLAPLVIIFTSNSLTVELHLNAINTTCPNVRSLNFDKESLENWRDPTIRDNLIGQSITTWNSTTATTAEEGWFDYYTTYSSTMELTATMAVYTQQEVARPAVSDDICGGGWNCSYTIEFVAPGYKCEELAVGVGATVGKLGEHDPPEKFGIDYLLPRGNYSYQALAMGGEYWLSQVSPVSTGGMPTEIKPPFPKNLGAFRTEPIIWIGYAERVDPVPTNRSMPGFDEAFVPHVFACEHYETAYTVQFKYRNGKQTANVTDRQYLRKVVDTKWLQDELNPSPHAADEGVDNSNNDRETDGTNDGTVAFPESNYVFPQQVERYRKVAAYHSVGKLMREFLQGSLESNNVLNPISNTKALQTKLLDARQKWFPFGDLQSRLQSLYEDIVLSMLADTRFLTVVWAANPDIISGPIADNSTDYRDSAYPCQRSRDEIRYKYHARDLWIVYSLALLLALTAILIGTRAVLANEGVLHDTRFSNIVAATRGPALDKLGWHSKGAADALARGGGGDHGRHLPRDIKNIKVGYGIVPLPGAGEDENQAGQRHSAAFSPARFDSYPHHLYGGEDNSRMPGRMWEADEVRYGFGLEGDVRQLLRNEGARKRGRSTG